MLCITKFIDVVCILPMGYGKTACFSFLPGSIDLYYGSYTEERAIIIVISPLTALMKDQVQELRRRDLSTGFIDTESEEGVKIDVVKRKYSIAC